MWHNIRISRKKSLIRIVSIVFILSTIVALPAQPGLANEHMHTLRGVVQDHEQQITAGATDQPQFDLTVRGMLLSVDLLGLLQLWVIHTGEGGEQSVQVGLDLLELLDGDAPPVGSWVAADVNVILGNLVAVRVRLDDHEPGEIIARLVSGVSSETIAARYSLIQEGVLLTSGDIYLFSSPSRDEAFSELLHQMADDPQIHWVELNYVSRAPEGHPYKTWAWGGPDPQNFSEQDAFAQVNLAPALASHQGDGVTVAVLDTGLDLDHPALAGDWLPGYDVVADDDQPQEEGPGMAWGHGTHIAGVIQHIAPNSKLLPVRVLDPDGRGNTFTLAYAIEWATEHGADVINMSLGTRYDSTALGDIVQAAIDQGVIVVAAAGNGDTNQVHYPAGYAGAIAITALDGGNRKADFANFGNWVTLAAPGIAVTSTIVGPDGSGYASWSGTSMSTAFVTGAAALARQMLPDAPVQEIAHTLTGSARSIDADNANFIGQLGGLLDIGAAMETNATPTATSPVTPEATPTPSQTAQATPSASPSITATATITVTPDPGQTPAPTATPMPTPTESEVGAQGWKVYLPLLEN
jgi:subtilisin family serine protease